MKAGLDQKQDPSNEKNAGICNYWDRIVRKNYFEKIKQKQKWWNNPIYRRQKVSWTIDQKYQFFNIE